MCLPRFDEGDEEAADFAFNDWINVSQGLNGVRKT